MSEKIISRYTVPLIQATSTLSSDASGMQWAKNPSHATVPLKQAIPLRWVPARLARPGPAGRRAGRGRRRGAGWPPAPARYPSSCRTFQTQSARRQTGMRCTLHTRGKINIKIYSIRHQTRIQNTYIFGRENAAIQLFTEVCIMVREPLFKNI